jgi:hypothetical protein
MDVDPIIRKEVRGRYLAWQRGEETEEVYEEHGDLVRLKIASLLAILEGRVTVNTEDWRLAGTVLDTSFAVRDQVQAKVDAEAKAIEEKTTYVQSHRAVAGDDAVMENRIEKTMKRVYELLEKFEGKANKRIVQGQLSKSQRDFFPEAISRLDGAGVVIESTGPGEGNGPDQIFLELVPDEG